MKKYLVHSIFAMLGVGAAAAFAAQPPAPPLFNWKTVVNNNDLMPPSTTMPPSTPKNFNSYNQPSVNVNGLVVIRARSKGGEGGGGGGGGEAVVNAPGSGGENQPVHGIYTRDMSKAGSTIDPILDAIDPILDRKTKVPQPNNAHYPPSNPLLTTFIETPSFPRIDMLSDTIATRGNHQPVWVYEVGIDPDTGEPIETRAGTTGIYTNPFGDLITGAAKLGAVPGFEFFAVPGLEPPTMFDVFPGAPAVTGGNTIVFKGNYTVNNVGKTGVFYRELVDMNINDGPGGGTNSVVLIANNTDTKIPGTDQVFGSTSPPSAANGKVVFAGFDNEEAPTLGGIYQAPLVPYDPDKEQPNLSTLVSIGQKVPDESGNKAFNNLGEGNAFDGRYVGFWGAWGNGARTVRLYCPTEGNKDRRDYCNQQLVCAGTVEKIGDPNSTCDETGCWQEKKVPVQQGIFLHDTDKGTTRTVAKTGAQFDEFVFWNYSGKTPCTGGGHSEEGAEDDGEPARWRSSAFVAVSGERTAFKAVAGGGVKGGCGSCHSGEIGSVPPSPFHGRRVGIFFNKKPGQDIITAVDTRTDGPAVDPEAPDVTKVTEVGLEREGLRGEWLAVSAKMAVAGGTEEDGMAGIYISPLPKP